MDAAASVAVVAARAGFPVRLATGEGMLLDVKGGGSDAEALLDRLAVVSPSTGTAPDLLSMARPGGALVVVTGDSGQPDRLAGVRRYDRVICVRVSPDDMARPAPGVNILDVPDLDRLVAAWEEAGR